MCAPNRLRDSKTRWMMVVGNFSLVAALLLWSFAPSAARTHFRIDGFSGLLFGVSIGANLFAIRRGRSCRSLGPAQR